MSKRQSREWNSDFANCLKEITGAYTVEHAVVLLVDKKLRILSELAPPIDLKKMASICGINPKFKQAPMKEDGRLVLWEGEYHIQLNQQHNLRRQRFSAAHEINHKILKIGDILSPKKCAGIGQFTRKREEEWLCDFGAKNLLLLTAKYLVPVVQDCSFSIKTINEIEQMFQVSFEAAVRSVVETALDPIAVVYFAEGVRKEQEAQSRTIPMFPEWAVKPTLRVVRFYKSATFPMEFHRNKSISCDHSCIQVAYHTNKRTRGLEKHTFDDKEYFHCSVEAEKRHIYVKGILQPGVIALLSSPQYVQ